jgi:hypothetical protein
VKNSQHNSKSHSAASTRGDGLDRQHSVDLGGFSNPMLGLLKFQAVMARMLLARQHELLDFLSHRCAQDLQLVDQIAAAKAPDALTGIIGDFYSSTVREYAEEMGRAVDSAPLSVTVAGDATRASAKRVAETVVHARSA